MIDLISCHLFSSSIKLIIKGFKFVNNKIEHSYTLFKVATEISISPWLNSLKLNIPIC